MEHETAGRRPWTRTLSNGVVLTLVLGVIGVYYTKSQRGWSLERVKNAIHADLPVGSRDSTVVDWLRQHRFETTEETGLPEQRRAEMYTKQFGYQIPDTAKVLWAEVPEPNVGLLESGRISVVFVFDGLGRLKKILYRELVYEL